MKDAAAKLKELFASIGMTDEAKSVEQILALPVNELQEEVDYLRDLKEQASQAERTTSGAEQEKYRNRRETLIKIMELIYLA